MNIKAQPILFVAKPWATRGLLALLGIIIAVGLWGEPLRAETGGGPGLPPSLSFCGENVPLNRSDVYMDVDQELVLLVGARSRVWVTLRGRSRIMPLVEAALREAGAPNELKYAPMGLSNLLPHYSSGEGRGIWRLSKAQATALGLKVDKSLDERLDPYLSSQAVAKKLKQNQQRFGSWTLALAALVGDEAEITKLVAETGLKNYYELPLSNTTERSMSWVLAAKIMYSNPGAYGYQPQGGRDWPSYQRRKAGAGTDMAALAKQLNISPKALKDANPHLLTQDVPAGVNIYTP